MRRNVVLLMLFFGLLTVVAGITEALPRHQGAPVFHIVVATIFIVLCLTHIILNRKAVIKYIKDSK